MNLLDVNVGKWYDITTTCQELKFWELGIMPEEKVRVLKKQGGLILLELEPRNIFAIRKEQAKCIKVK